MFAKLICGQISEIFFSLHGGICADFFFFHLTPMIKERLHSYLPNIYQIISMPLCLRSNHHTILISVLILQVTG